MRFQSHPVLAGAALAWLVSACTVVTTPAPQSPPNDPSHPVVAGPAAPAGGHDEAEPSGPAHAHGEPVVAGDTGTTLPPPRPRDHRRGPLAASELDRSSEPIAQNTPPAPKQRDHRQGQPDVAPTVGSGGGHTVVPIRRGRDRLGSAVEFQIEPTAGPVGTTVIIYGDFRRAIRAGGLNVSFHGTRQAVTPIYVTTDRIAVVVPRGTRTGPVRVAVEQRELWNGSFAVTKQDRNLFVPIDAGSGLLGAVYQLAPNTKQLPNFETLGRPFATIVVPALQVAPRRFDAGFPGLDATGKPLLEWFGIRFMGMIDVPAAGEYAFRLNSDDGSRLFINNQLVVDNDGVHAPRAREGRIHLSAGRHDIVVEYFQGPRFQIALELSWRRGNAPWKLVPPEAFTRYTGYDCSSEPEILCCQGTSPECRACQRNAKATIQEWQQTCRDSQRPGAGNPHTGHPGHTNCAQPPQRMCCQSNTPQCRQCRDDAAAELAAWQQQCHNTRPGAGHPGHTDCSRPPERTCCQGQSAKCKQCRQEAAEERAAWDRQCVTTLPVDNRVDCSKAPPQRTCCKALTPNCKECQQQAQAEQAQWQQQCRRR